MAKLLIYTLWHQGDPGDLPWLTDAVDEYTIEEAGIPPDYEKKRVDPLVRELVIEVDEDAVRKLFDPPVVKGLVVDG